MEEVKQQVKEKIEKIINEGINIDNLDLLYKLIDIHKDLENEEYWKIKKEVMKNDVRRIWEKYANAWIWRPRLWNLQ